jgi:hypothetical protein
MTDKKINKNTEIKCSKEEFSVEQPSDAVPWSMD